MSTVKTQENVYIFYPESKEDKEKLCVVARAVKHVAKFGLNWMAIGRDFWCIAYHGDLASALESKSLYFERPK